MALTNAEVDKIAARVLDLSRERFEAEVEKSNAEREERLKSPEALALRVSDLEENTVSWTQLAFVIGVLWFVGALLYSRGRHGS